MRAFTIVAHRSYRLPAAKWLSWSLSLNGLSLMFRCLLLTTLLLLSGCSTVSLFSPYPAQAQAWKQDLQSEQGQQALLKITRHTDSGDQLLYALEAGRTTQIMGDFAASEKRSEEHTSELQSLMRISYAVFCLKKNKRITNMQHKK